MNQVGIAKLKKFGKGAGNVFGKGFVETGRTVVAGFRGLPPETQGKIKKYRR